MKTSKWVLQVVFSAVLVAILFVAFPSAALAQDTIHAKTYPIPTANSGPEILAVDGSHLVYFTEVVAGKIGSLNALTNTITEWPMPNPNSAPHHIGLFQGAFYIGEQGAQVTGTAGASGGVAKFVPGTGALTEWIVSGSYVDHVVNVGRFIFYNDQNNNTIGRVNQTTGAVTTWAIPVSLPDSNGICADSSGQNIYVTGDTFLVALNVPTNTFSTFNVPNTLFLTHPTCLADGRVMMGDDAGFFGTQGNPVVGDSVWLFDPSTDNFTQWQSNNRPLAIRHAVSALQSDGSLQISFSGFFLPVIGTFNTATAPFFFSSVVSPTTTVVAPASVVPTITTSVLLPTATVVVPTTQSLTGSTSVGIEEWTLPVTCPSSPTLPGECVGLDWMAFLGTGVIVSAEQANTLIYFQPLGGQHIFGK